MPAMVIPPSPPAFLDPLTLIENCYYYAVPKFFGLNHPNTRWLITMIRNNEDERLKHKMEVSPGAFKGVYYQMMDYPQLYNPEDVAASPMFKRQAVVYLTPLGMAIYLGNVAIVDMLLKYKDSYDEPLCDPSEAQYATHLQDGEAGDFHAFPPFLVMLRRSCFACAQSLLKAGWDPNQPVAMPMRRRFERRVLYFRDWLEVAFSVLAARPMYSLPTLLREMTKGVSYTPIHLPLDLLLPPEPAKAEPVGLIGVDELPNGVTMIGVRSLMDMAEHYDRYLQMRQCARQVAALKREALAVGLNPEVLMIQAQDFDGGAVAEPDDPESNNALRRRKKRSGANNNSADESSNVTPQQQQQRQQQQRRQHLLLNVNMSAGKKKVDDDPKFASEGCRILHYALVHDPQGKSMQVCIEAFCVLLRRGFYLMPTKPVITSSVSRDIRNTASLMLNLIQREQDKVDKIVAKIKSGVKKFAHLEEHKQLENRKTACILYINKLVGILTQLLLQTKALVDFIQADFPPFNPLTCSITLNPYLSQKFEDIKFGVIREFNSNRDSWVYLDTEMLQTVSKIAQMQLRFKVGKVPTIPPKGKKANKNKSNMSNTNSCFVSYTRVQRRPKTIGVSAAATTDATPSMQRSSVFLDRQGSSALVQIDNSSCDGYSGLEDEDATQELIAECKAMPELASFMATSNEEIAGLLSSSSATAAAGHARGDTSGMEHDNCGGMEKMLASLCREVDGLFQPLEKETDAGGCPTASQRCTEHSTIEPELAPTPMPTPETDSPTAPTDRRSMEFLEKDEQEEEGRIEQHPVSAAQRPRRRKLRQSGVLRFLNRFSSVKALPSAAAESEAS